MLTKAPKTMALKRRSVSRRKPVAVQGRKDEGVNMLHALRDFVGCVEGPADLSTSRRHLENLGR
jgi:hypothetical protein